MPVIIQSKNRYSGTITLSDLNVETIVIEVDAQQDDYIVEGYIDLSALQTDDNLIVKEYIAVDGVNYELFLTTSYLGTPSNPVIRFHSKQFTYDMKYKVTVTQTSGTPRSFAYRFLLEILGTA
jgi:hypothetical protein